jgi:hypothetical protein
MRYCATISSSPFECSGDGRRRKSHRGQDVDGRREDAMIKDVRARLSEKGGRR